MTVRALVVGSLAVSTAFHMPTRPEQGQVISATQLDTDRKSVV